jgi:hypothetical protein
LRIENRNGEAERERGEGNKSQSIVESPPTQVMPINLHDDVVAWGIISIISIPGTYQ